MVFGIVKNHQGHILCTSEPGKGTTFKIHLPSRPRQDEEPKREITTQAPRGGGETILVVDDDASVRDLAAEMLREFGYTVDTVESGEKALTYCRTDNGLPDLVVLDLIMPGMGGRRCLEELLRLYPKCKVLIASGYSEHGYLKESPVTAAGGFISKPYELKKLLRTVRDILDK